MLIQAKYSWKGLKVKILKNTACDVHIVIYMACDYCTVCVRITCNIK